MNSKITVYTQDYLGNWQTHIFDSKDDVFGFIASGDGGVQEYEVEGVEFEGKIPTYDELMDWMNAPHSIEVELAIPGVWKPGEWRLSVLEIGPRGGKHWGRLTYGLSATGALYRTQLETGRTYKTTYWANGWPHSETFTVNADGTITDHA